MNIIMFGAPGAGKGTHADRLAERYNLDHISTGDLLRQEVADNTALGKRVKEVMNRGELVDDNTVMQILSLSLAKRQRGIIFDGFPRTVQQAKMLDNVLSEQDRNLSCVIQINVSQEELIRRIQERAQISHRDDDNEGTLRHRLQEYEEKTLPIIEYYKKTDLIVEIDGQSEIEETSQRILAALHHRLGI